jgi:hypothetical protein
MAKKEVVGKKEYKNKVIFLRLSRTGNHVYAFNNEGVLGENVESLITNVKEVERVLEGVKGAYAKMSVMEVKEEGDESPSDLLSVMVKRAEEEKKKAQGAYGEPQ